MFFLLNGIVVNFIVLTIQELLGPDPKTCPAEENVEAISQFFNTIGKQLDESPKSRRVNDLYFSRLKELTVNTQLAPRLRFMVRDVLDLRANNWVPRREEVSILQFLCSSYFTWCTYIVFFCNFLFLSAVANYQWLYLGNKSGNNMITKALMSYSVWSFFLVYVYGSL